MHMSNVIKAFVTVDFNTIARLVATSNLQANHERRFINRDCSFVDHDIVLIEAQSSPRQSLFSKILLSG